MLSKDFKEFIELLNENNVKYLVVGGYAVALHGHPRYTKDLDVWIELSSDNAGRVLHFFMLLCAFSISIYTLIVLYLL